VKDDVVGYVSAIADGVARVKRFRKCDGI